MVSIEVEKNPAISHLSAPPCNAHVMAVCLRVCGVTPFRPADAAAFANPRFTSPTRAPWYSTAQIAPDLRQRRRWPKSLRGIGAGARRLFVMRSPSAIRYMVPRSRSNQPPTVFGSNPMRSSASLRVPVYSPIRINRAMCAALTGSTAGQGAEVLDADAGTHIDPVVGGTVNNAGRYTWSASPAGWNRIGGTGLSGVNADLRAIGIVKMSGLSSAARATAIHEALAAGVCRIYEKGTWSVNAGIIFPANALLEVGPGVILQKVGATEFIRSANVGTADRISGIKIEGQGIIRGLGAVTGSITGIWGDVALLNCDDGYVRGVTFEATDCGVQHSGYRFDVEHVAAPKTAVAFNGPGLQQVALQITHTGTSGDPVRLDACPSAEKSVTVGDIVARGLMACILWLRSSSGL